MKRDKQWWGNLSRDERSELYWLERAHAHPYSGMGGYLPDDCGECSHCGSPALGGGMCVPCFNRMMRLIIKADAARTKEVQ